MSGLHCPQKRCSEYRYETQRKKNGVKVFEKRELTRTWPQDGENDGSLEKASWMVLVPRYY
jgi:hypothetical protein